MDIAGRKRRKIRVQRTYLKTGKFFKKQPHKPRRQKE
jgi:hypothetical protein